MSGSLPEQPTFRAYHATNRVAAEQIRREGFRVGSWFAFRPEHALAHGRGRHLFTVELQSAELNRESFREDQDAWQFHTLAPIPADAIVGYQRVPTPEQGR